MDILKKFKMNDSKPLLTPMSMTTALLARRTESSWTRRSIGA
jgi:hypothetical protein